MNKVSDSILGAFLYETNSLLEQLDSIVLNGEQANDFTEDDVNSIFRIMHTIKGASAMMEFNSIMKIAHRAEDMFAIVRDKSIAVVPQNLRPELFDLLFKVIDFFREEIEKVEAEKPLTEDIDTLLEKVNSFVGQIDGSAAKTEATTQEPEAQGAAEIPAEFPFGVRVFFDEGSGMENLRAGMIIMSVKEMCDPADFAFIPSDTSAEDAQSAIVANGFLICFRSDKEREFCMPSISATPSVSGYEKVNADVSEPPMQEEPKDTAPTSSVPDDKPQSKAPVAPAPQNAPQVQVNHNKESLISVNLSKLDQLQAVVGEIVITESMVTSSPDLKGVKLDLFTKSARQLRKLTDELQDVSMSLRMVPLSGTFQKMNRIVRDMSKKLDKQVKLTILGENTEVDKTIVDTIGDPIMHIVRNSMDHGIETSAADRVAAGKDACGELTLSAMHTGSEVIIEIIDDGKGVDCNAVLNKAIRNGIAQEGYDYSEKEILAFLLAPGFSTKAQVTEFSGRGVGMDVVRQNVEAIGGTISIKSDYGKGMCTTLKIPLTMAIMDGMEIAVGDCIFTLPINSIKQSFKITDGDIIRDAGGGEMFKCLGTFYPVLRLRDRLKLDEGYTNIDDGILIWLDNADESYCLFADELLGEQQVVVKPLPQYLSRFNTKRNGISGCTILGDGNISFILDASNIFSQTDD